MKYLVIFFDINTFHVIAQVKKTLAEAKEFIKTARAGGRLTFECEKTSWQEKNVALRRDQDYVIVKADKCWRPKTVDGVLLWESSKDLVQK